MKKIIFLYIPVLHQGYMKFFEKFKDQASTLYVVGNDLIEEFMSLHKEIRALSPEMMQKIIKDLGIFEKVEILTRDNIDELKGRELISANEATSRNIIEKYLPNEKIELDTVFLRWDESSVMSQTSVSFDRKSTDPFDIEMVKKADIASEKSGDWWRHVGAVLVRDGKILIEANNHHVPSDHTPYANGDPRDFVKAGTDSYLATALHGEQTILVEAVRQNISLDGTDLYVTCFPCPMCAKMVAYSGIRRVFFSSGHASIDGESILKANGLELIFVEADPEK